MNGSVFIRRVRRHSHRIGHGRHDHRRRVVPLRSQGSASRAGTDDRGLTHSFSRNGFTWDVGLHYCGTFGRDQFAGRILDWLSGGTIEFRSVGTVYDRLHFPDEFEVSVGRPAEAYKMELKDRFPDSAAEIEAYFEALLSAEEAGQMVGSERAMPEPVRSAHFWWNKRKIERWCSRTTGEVIGELISDPKLAAVLSAQWGTYGGKPKEASFAIHATIMGHYLDGAAYPVGGAAAIAKGLVPVIEAAGGSARAGTPVSEIPVEDGKAVGVRTSAGEEYRAPTIVSAIGAGETVKRLLPEDIRQQDWASEIATFKPAICHFEVFVGFEGDIARHGATRANHWFYQSWNTDDGIWLAADNEPLPMMFVSFPSLKDPAHDPGPAHRHTGQMMVFTDWSVVAEFADGGAAARPQEWSALKEKIEARMMAFFAEKFPALAPLVVYRELGTPLATAAFTAHEKGRFLRHRDHAAPHAVGCIRRPHAGLGPVPDGPGCHEPGNRRGHGRRHVRRRRGRYARSPETEVTQGARRRGRRAP